MSEEKKCDLAIQEKRKRNELRDKIRVLVKAEEILQKDFPAVAVLVHMARTELFGDK